MHLSSSRSLAALFAAILLLAAAGCGEDSASPVATEQLPSVDPGSVTLGSGYSGDLGQAAMPCLVRFDFAPPYSDVDCNIVEVNGAADWKMSCPDHPYLPLEDEFRFDDQGRLIVEVITEPASNGGGVFTMTSFSQNPFATPPCMVLESNATGAPTVARCLRPDVTLPDGTVLLGDTTSTFVYDAFGRLTDDNFSETATGKVIMTSHITYDDAARRRDFEVVVDPGQPLEGLNSSVELLDENMRLSVRSVKRTGGDDLEYTYSYDEAGRLLTQSVDLKYGNGPHVSYLQHRIYDCQ